MESFLIAGLGNVGDEYARTRHNIGFMVLDALAEASNIVFEDRRYGFVADMPLRGRRLTLLKPSTYMNLSGGAVRYWMNARRIKPGNLLVVVDDTALPFGRIRIRTAGSEGGHNGLKSITSALGTQEYARLRFGVGGGFPQGGQADWVLSDFPPEEAGRLAVRIGAACEAVRSFCLAGPQFAMNNFNNK